MSKVPISVPFVCRKSINFTPNLTPVISNLSIFSSPSGIYTTVYIYGNNFSTYGRIGTSVVNFVEINNNNTSYNNLPVSFYSSQKISFIVPLSAQPGNYKISVVNQNNQISLISNSMNYTIY